MLRDNPLAFIAFDLLYLNGELLMDCPLQRRREALAEFAGDLLRTTSLTPVTTASEIQAAFEASRARRNEGIVLKDPASAYTPGRRGQAWLKLKTHLPTLDCVVTAAEHGHGKRRDVLSDYTFAVWDRDPAEPGATLVNVGKAYSGVTDEEIAQLTKLFHELSRQDLGRVHLVEPKIVLEIACDQIQSNARHASGFALRFPRIKRIRFDKSAPRCRPPRPGSRSLRERRELRQGGCRRKAGRANAFRLTAHAAIRGPWRSQALTLNPEIQTLNPSPEAEKFESPRPFPKLRCSATPPVLAFERSVTKDHLCR